MRFRTLRDYIASLSTVTPTGLDRFPLHDLSNPTDMSAATFDGVVNGVSADATLARTTGATFTGNVVVTDANADGEALAYDQQNARVGTGFMVKGAGVGSAIVEGSLAGDLTLSDLGAGVDEKHFMVRSDGGTLSIRSQTDALANKVILAQLSSVNGSVNFTGATGVSVPAATAATHAAQVTAIDAATGRLAIGGREIGDTGWRDVSSLLATGWTGSVRIRRSGYTVEIWFTNADYTSGGSTDFYLPPSGFRPSLTLYKNATKPFSNDASASPTLAQAVITGSRLRLPTTGNDWNGSFTFTTTEAWPVSLPGTAA